MKSLVRYIPTVLIAGCIAYVSLIREVGFSMPHFAGADKVVHFAMYFFLAAVMLMDMRRDNRTGKRMCLVVFLVCAVYGGVIEVLQELFFYPRTGDWRDWLADCAGVATGIGVMLLWNRRKKEGIS